MMKTRAIIKNNIELVKNSLYQGKHIIKYTLASTFPNTVFPIVVKFNYMMTTFLFNHMRIMRTSFFAALFTLIIVGCGNTNKVEQDYLPEVCVWKNGQWASEWMQKYVEYARGNDSFYADERIMDIWPNWSLGYVDDDTIPEMLLLCPCEANGCKVLTINDGKVSEWNSWRCGVSYIPKSGLINNEDGNMGHYYDRIIKLKDGEYNLVYMKNKVESIDLIDSNYVYYKGKKYSISHFPQEYNRYADDSVKQALYSSIGQSIDFNALDNSYPTAFFENGWTPTVPDNITEKDYTITLIVK